MKKNPLTLMGGLAPGSAHPIARPSAWSPIDMNENIPPHVSVECVLFDGGGPLPYGLWNNPVQRAKFCCGCTALSRLSSKKHKTE